MCNVRFICANQTKELGWSHFVEGHCVSSKKSELDSEESQPFMVFN